MNPSRLFILRPVATSLLMAAIMLVGLFAYRFLPLSALPEVDYPTIQVQTFYPGASPDVMVSSVTAPLEVQLGQMPGLIQMSSTSSAGASVITLQFSLDLSLDVAEQEVQAAINAAGNLLPSDLPAPPIYAKVNPGRRADPDAGPDLEDDAVDRGRGSRRYAARAEDLAIARGGARQHRRRQPPGDPRPGQYPPARRLRPQHRRSAHDARHRQRQHAQGQFRRAEPRPTRSTPTTRSRTPPNTTTSSSPTATARRCDCRMWRPPRRARRTRNWPPGSTPITAVILNVQRQPGANVIAVVDSIEKLLPSLQASLPAAIDVRVVTDRTTTIRASVADVEFELGLAVVLVVIVIFLFLRSPSATLIPSLSVPLSLVGTLAVMYLCGFSLNNLSLMALTIATGFVVDDAIVMIENISRYIEAGDPPLVAALEGLGADRLHDHLADRLADRGADPAVVHARCRRPAVSRVCDHAGRHDRHFRGGGADPGADAVRQNPAPPALIRNVADRAQEPAMV